MPGADAGATISHADVRGNCGKGVLDLIMISGGPREGRIDGDAACGVAATDVVRHHVALRHRVIRRPHPHAP